MSKYTIKLIKDNLPKLLKDHKGDKTVKQDGTIIVNKTNNESNN